MTSTFTPDSAWKIPGSFWRVSAIKPCLIACLTSLGFTLTALRAAAPDSKPAGVTITGQVSNAATKNFLQGAVVALEGTDQMVVTDFEGRYQLRGVTATSPILQVSYSGLDPARVPVVLQADVTVRNVELTSSIYTLDPFTVTGAREGVAKAQVLQREAPNVKNVIASDAFGSVADGNIADMLTYVTGIVGEYNYEQQLSFLPGWARGFGIHANYTTIETAGKFGGTTQLNSSAPAAGSGVPGFSPKASSMGLSYRGFGWDLRLMSVYRGERLYRAATSTGLLSYAGSTTLWSFKGKYALTNRYGLFLNVDNLTSAPISNTYFTYPERTDYYGVVAPVIVGGITGRF